MQMDSFEADVDRSEMFTSNFIKAGNMVGNMQTMLIGKNVNVMLE